MFELSEDISKKCEDVYNASADLVRGDVLEHSVIKGILLCEPHTGCWGHVMKRVRRRLERERGIATWPQVNVGYKLLTHEEQLALPAERTRRGIRQVRRGRNSVSALPDSQISFQARRLKAALTAVAADDERILRSSLKTQLAALETLSVPPRAIPAATLEQMTAQGV